MHEKEKCVQLLLKDFLTRRDVVAARQQWQDRRSREWISRPRPVKAGPQLESLVAFHVYGPEGRKAPPLNYINNKTGALVADGRGFDRLGAYAVTPDNKCGWLCLDFDGPGHPLPLADPTATMLACVERCRALGVPSHIEMSGSGHGWHLWVFFENPVPASDARLLGHRVAPTDHLLVTGEPADIRTGRGIECFPKQNTVSDKKIGAGNMVWLPHWFGAIGGGNQFHRFTDERILAPYLPDEFERLPVERLQDILTQVPDDIRHFVLKTKDGLKAPSAPKSSPHAASTNYAPSDTQMIQAALDHISPDVSYDDWLRIGMALHHWDAQAGLSLWDAWSALGEKYVDGEPPLKWDGFTSGGGVTLGTLFDMAKKAGWTSPVHKRVPLPSDEEINDFIDVDPSALLDGAAFKRTINAETALSGSDGITVSDRKRLPVIIVNNRTGPALIEEAWAAIRASNYPPRIFQRNGALVRLTMNTDPPKIIPMNFVSMYGLLWRVANCVVDANDMQKSVNPPKDLASDMLEYPDPTLPHLDAVVSTPVYDREGNLVQAPGYHRTARLWMHIAPGTLPYDVPTKPSDAQIAEAVALLNNELFVDFPFTSQSGRAHAVAALLQPFIRRMVDGPTPMYLLESPSPGTGKTLLAKVISRIVLGKSVNAASLDLDEQAIAKKITAILLGAPQVVLIDNINVRTGLKSAALAAAMTAEPYSERVLYQPGMTELPNHALWLITANNPSMSLEIARRCVSIRIDARHDRPWRLHGFKHEPLDDWVVENRAALITAILTIVRGWIVAGRPSGKLTFGSFDSWARITGGILQFSGIPGFLSNLEDLYEAADTEGGEWREFVAAWWSKFGGRVVPFAELLDLANEKGLLPSVVGDQGSRAQKTRLGRALSAMRNRQFDSYRIVQRRNSHTKQSEYTLEEVNADDQRIPHGMAPVLPLFAGDRQPSSASSAISSAKNNSKNQPVADDAEDAEDISNLLDNEGDKKGMEGVYENNRGLSSASTANVEIHQHNQQVSHAEDDSRLSPASSADLADFEPEED
ncbi:MAG TPA: PriCT-2 domain-containing protein [bacterium]|nr:PriCT-2 domain-containing protein [bacterium]